MGFVLLECALNSRASCCDDHDFSMKVRYAMNASQDHRGTSTKEMDIVLRVCISFQNKKQSAKCVNLQHSFNLKLEEALVRIDALTLRRN